MSRRTAETQKAVRIAWENEQKLVAKGKGTRDWTPDQQRDILESGKAHDADGRAFDGQHMKSAAVHPEYQGDPGNIQFLTREEHKEAHKGDWKNPTNWYYDPVTKEYHDFGDGKYIPCEVIELSDPIRLSNAETFSEGEMSQENQCAQKTDSSQKNETGSKPNQPISSSTPSRSNTPPSAPIESKPFIIRGFHRVVNGWRNFESNHPILATILVEGSKLGLQAAATYGTSKVIDSSLKRAKASTTNATSVPKPTSTSTAPSKSVSGGNPSPSVNADIPTQVVSRALPKENDVSAHQQRYHYKDGSIQWKDKTPYHRGGK